VHHRHHHNATFCASPPSSQRNFLCITAIITTQLSVHHRHHHKATFCASPPSSQRKSLYCADLSFPQFRVHCLFLFKDHEYVSVLHIHAFSISVVDEGDWPASSCSCLTTRKLGGSQSRCDLMLIESRTACSSAVSFRFLRCRCFPATRYRFWRQAKYSYRRYLAASWTFTFLPKMRSCCVPCNGVNT
jgi:hypothetical protein